MALEQHECGGHEVRPAVPRSGACVRDAARADGVAVALVLGVAEGGEYDALLGGHDPATLVAGADARNRRGVDRPGLLAARRAYAPNRAARIRWGRGPMTASATSVGVRGYAQPCGTSQFLDRTLCPRLEIVTPGLGRGGSRRPFTASRASRGGRYRRAARRSIASAPPRAQRRRHCACYGVAGRRAATTACW